MSASPEEVVRKWQRQKKAKDRARNALTEMRLLSGRSVPYYPQLATVTGSVLSAILLHQIIYWDCWSAPKRFYKFMEPCAHPMYKNGDSWCEELKVTPAQFSTAMKQIATKINKGTSKTAILEDTIACFDDRGLMVNAPHLVLYFTDTNRVTWYQLNKPLLKNLLISLEGDDLTSELGFGSYFEEDS